MRRTVWTVVAALVWAVAGADGQHSPPVPQRGTAFRDFRLRGLDGKEAGLYERYRDRGKVIVLNLFATWCPPCREEIPAFVRIRKRYADRVVFVGVSFDRFRDAEPLRQFAKMMGINYDLWMGTPQLANYVQLRGIPRTFVLMPDFTVVEDITGMVMEEEFERFLVGIFERLSPATNAAAKRGGRR